MSAKEPDFEVGYGKPPIHSRFKKGQSGNPKGRAPLPKTVDERIQVRLDRKVKTASGEYIRLSDAVLNLTINSLLDRSKSPKWALEIISFLQKFDAKVTFEPSAGDAERLQRLISNVQDDTKRQLGVKDGEA